MKSKLQSPEFTQSLKTAAYRMRLKDELSLVQVSEEPLRFLMHLEHKFADDVDILFVAGYSNNWKDYHKDNRPSDKFAAGHCELNSGKLTLSIEQGKARDRAIIAALKKHPVFKVYEISLELSSQGADEAEIDKLEGEMSKIKPKDGHSREVFAQIKSALDEFKAVPAHEFEIRDLAMKKVEGLVKIWRAVHQQSTTPEDVAIENQLDKIEDWLKIHKNAQGKEKDHAEGYKLLDEYVDCANQLKNLPPDQYDDLLADFLKLLPRIQNWLPAHQEAAKTDEVLRTQYKHLSKALSEIPAAIQKLDEGVKKIAALKSNTKKAVVDFDSVVPSAAKFLQQAELKAGENADIDRIISKLELLEDNYNDGPPLVVQIESMLKNGVTDLKVFEDLHEDRMNELYSLRNEIDQFITKNKGFFAQLDAKKKKQVNALIFLQARIQKEILNAAQVLVTVNIALQKKAALCESEELKDAYNAALLMRGGSRLEDIEVLRFIKKRGYKTASPQLKEFLNTLKNSDINGGASMPKLYELYTQLGNNITQQALDQLFANTNAEELANDIADVLSRDAADELDDDMQKQVAIASQMPELIEASKLFQELDKATIDQYKTFLARIERIETYKKDFEANAQLPSSHPQHENAVAQNTVFLALYKSIKDRFQALKDAYKAAEEFAKIVKADKSSLIIEAFEKGQNTHAAQSFSIFAKTEFSEENVKAYKMLYSNAPEIVLTKYASDINIATKILQDTIQLANQIRPNNPSYATINAIPTDLLRQILNKEKPNEIFIALRNTLRTNLYDTFSRMKNLQPSTIFNQYYAAHK